MAVTAQNDAVQVIQATPDLWARLGSCSTAPGGLAGARMVLVMAPGGETIRAPRSTAERFVFRQAVGMCEIVFDGSPVFYIPNTDGAKYLNYLLHHPYQPIRALALEILINPEKGKVRAPNSKQTLVDARTKSEAGKELLALREELEESVALGLGAKTQRLREEIGKLEVIAGNVSLLEGDNGERARDNVRKAIEKVIKTLRKGGSDAQAFGQHLASFVSRGYELVYNQPENHHWS